MEASANAVAHVHEFSFGAWGMAVGVVPICDRSNGRWVGAGSVNEKTRAPAQPEISLGRQNGGAGRCLELVPWGFGTARMNTPLIKLGDKNCRSDRP